MKIVQIKTQEQAKQASEFLATLNAFEDSIDWNEEERSLLINSPFKAVGSESYHCWMMVDETLGVIGYIDLREHPLKNGGYYTDWFAVHKEYRSQGLGAQMLVLVEDFARSIGGRYILIETGDVDHYVRTRKFYENHGYVQVGHIPEYYYANWGMYIYQKML